MTTQEPCGSVKHYDSITLKRGPNIPVLHNSEAAHLFGYMTLSTLNTEALGCLKLSPLALLVLTVKGILF